MPRPDTVGDSTRHARGRRLIRGAAAMLAMSLLTATCTATTSTTAPGTVSADVPVAALTPEPAATAIPEPTSTATPVPRATPTPTPAPTATPTPSPTPEPAVPLRAALDVSSLDPTECPGAVATSQVTCSAATLPRNPFDPNANETVVVMTAFVDNGDPHDIGPVVFLQGGPGVGSIENAKRFVGGSHDVLFVDQRGTGYSEPKLNCPAANELWVSRHTDDVATRLVDPDTAKISSYRSCAARLQSEGIDLNDFNTSTAAADIELLRQLFGFEQWSLWGISYGTRLGLSVMRDYPLGVRAAVLDSVVPFEVDFFATLPENGWRSMTALDAACDEATCLQNHGDFLDNLAALTRQLDQSPVAVPVGRPVSGTTFQFRVTGRELIDIVFNQLYVTSSLGSLPRQIARAEFGGLEELASSYVRRRDPERIDVAIALYYSTWCREEFPFYDESIDDDLLESLRADFGSALSLALSADGVGQLCAIFGVVPAGEVENTPITSDIPTLVFAGAFDPITPPAWSKQVADGLANATYVELSDHAHGMTTSCPVSIRTAFLTDPTESLDLACAQATTAPDFD